MSAPDVNRRAPADPAQRGGGLFVYGSLRFPGVLRALLGRIPPHEPDSAPGWRAAAVPGEVYPALVAGDEDVPGLALDGLGPRDWEIVDSFEGPFYDLRAVELSSGRTEWAYVCAHPRAVRPDDWDPDWFAREHLGEYERDCADWRHEFLEGEQQS
jgi:gamma-glutamylcyclotransferase (GGCT)/AIG2-like uncharacterized protein YtfP